MVNERYPYQGMMLGKERLPQMRREKYDFLDDVFKEMRVGQIFRMILPTENIARAIKEHWLKMKTGKKMKGRTYKIPQGGCQCFVWFETWELLKKGDK